jgi:hypothetical protein
MFGCGVLVCSALLLSTYILFLLELEKSSDLNSMLFGLIPLIYIGSYYIDVQFAVAAGTQFITSGFDGSSLGCLLSPQEKRRSDNDGCVLLAGAGNEKRYNTCSLD